MRDQAIGVTADRARAQQDDQISGPKNPGQKRHDLVDATHDVERCHGRLPDRLGQRLERHTGNRILPGRVDVGQHDAIGGGDVKLLAMVGAMAGLEKGLEVLLWAFIIGSCAGLVVLIWKLGLIALVTRATQLVVGVISLGTLLRVPNEEQEALKLPIFLGPCVAVALVAAFVRVPLMM